MTARRWKTSDLDDLVSAETVLVATDFDGTLSPIVPNPAEAAPHPAAAAAMAAIANIANTPLAILSGRPFSFLSAIDVIPSGALLVGSHGAEYLRAGIETDEASAERLRTLAEQMTAIHDAYPGAEIEVKPASVALHYRHVAEPKIAEFIAAIEGGPSQIDGVETQHGKLVVELAITTANKGTAINQLRADLGVDAVVYFGDDTTDEDAFVVLGESDLGVRVGDAETTADVSAEDPGDVIAIINELARRRSSR